MEENINLNYFQEEMKKVFSFGSFECGKENYNSFPKQTWFVGCLYVTGVLIITGLHFPH